MSKELVACVCDFGFDISLLLLTFYNTSVTIVEIIFAVGSVYVYLYNSEGRLVPYEQVQVLDRLHTYGALAIRLDHVCGIRCLSVESTY